MKDVESKVLPVLEMSCAVCANNVEGTVKALPGVEEASVNFAANTLSVTYHPSVISLQKMQEAVQAADMIWWLRPKTRWPYRKRWRVNIIRN